ncbi:MAG: ATP-binding cassette domain-containing protein, partial [Bacteroidales bacterium]|nr:ATP-binding cassette domain-containing protein [Bacteroidales bacterium]
RKYISIIPQQESLFDGNVLENIVVGEEMPDISKVMKICEVVGMIDFIDSLPRGMLTQIGEKGKFLSGGERVKISVARALYRDPKVLVMDEITSHLDELSADRIYSLCRKLAESGITIINITHDRKFLEYSDYIVNLDKCDHTQVNSRTPLCCGDLT